ncbi:MAG TPA: hypothetical protein VFF30_07370 [Nitrososphaerales archaeon]|nr:hypothetical protein [Nitrososphaerales archaeon]
MLTGMLDVSVDRKDSSRAVAYFDGKDARVFCFLREKLGCDERAQNAIILVGLVAKLEASSRKADRLKLRKTKQAFGELVGVPYEEFDSIVRDFPDL